VKYWFLVGWKCEAESEAFDREGGRSARPALLGGGLVEFCSPLVQQNWRQAGSHRESEASYWIQHKENPEQHKEEAKVIYQFNNLVGKTINKITIFRYKSLVSIEATLLENTEALEKLRNLLLKEMKSLQTAESQTLVNEAVECHLRTILSDEVKAKSK